MNTLRPVNVVHEGRTFTGMYRFLGDALTVKFASRELVVPLNGAKPRQTAEQVLLHMVQERKKLHEV